MHLSIAAIAAAFCTPFLSAATSVSQSTSYSGIGYPEQHPTFSSWSIPTEWVYTAPRLTPSAPLPTSCRPGQFCTIPVPAAPEVPGPAVSDPPKPAVTPGQTKRSNPVYFNLECGGDNMAAAPRKCNNKALDGNWCAKNCKCTWTGCIECGKFDGCSAAVVSATCAAEGITGWGCDCVGFGPKDGAREHCAS